MKSAVKYIILAVVAVLLSSCAKKLTYMQDLVPGETFETPVAEELEIKPGDRLKIAVFSRNPQLSMAFNMQGGSFSMEAAEKEQKKESYKYDQGMGYLVNQDGCIEFPILGLVKVAGLDVIEVKDLLVQLIKDGNYIKDPIVTVDFLNFRITLLGEFASTGNKYVDGNQVNLLQAVAMGGDLLTTADFGKIKVIRTHTGSREVYELDLYSKEVYQSPAFYLQQDDVVYVPPRNAKLDASTSLALNLTGIFLSIINTAITVFYWATYTRR